MANKPIIAIDIDDVLAEGTNSLIESANYRYGLSLTQQDYHTVGGDFSGYYERVWQAHGVDGLVKYDDLAAEMALDQSHVPLLAGAEFALQQLAKRFHIVFITARPEAWESATRKWFKQHLAKDDIELYFAGSHHHKMALNKGQQAKQLGATLLIDDNVTNCQTAIDEGVDVILFGNYGWQRQVPPGMTHCKDWPAVLDYLDEARR
jgi:uncharacterized HAD superfamily protein